MRFPYPRLAPFVGMHLNLWSGRQTPAISRSRQSWTAAEHAVLCFIIVSPAFGSLRRINLQSNQNVRGASIMDGLARINTGPCSCNNNIRANLGGCLSAAVCLRRATVGGRPNRCSRHRKRPRSGPVRPSRRHACPLWGIAPPNLVVQGQSTRWWHRRNRLHVLFDGFGILVQVAEKVAMTPA